MGLGREYGLRKETEDGESRRLEVITRRVLGQRKRCHKKARKKVGEGRGGYMGLARVESESRGTVHCGGRRSRSTTFITHVMIRTLPSLWVVCGERALYLVASLREEFIANVIIRTLPTIGWRSPEDAFSLSVVFRKRDL